MVYYKCYFCNYNTTKICNLKNHIIKKKKCSYLIRGIEINDIDRYYELVELHKKDPNNDIWGIDYRNLPKPNYYNSDEDSDVDEESKIKYENFMDQNVYNKKFYCEYCNNEFSRKDNLKRHLLKCKSKQKIDTNNIPNISNSTIINNIDKSNNITNNITNNNNTIILKLNNYGEENKDIFLDKERMLMYFKEPFTAIPDIIKKLHFTPKKRPENTNIRIANISNGKIQVYKNVWKTRMKREVIRELIREYGTELGPIYEKYQKEGIINGKIREFENFWQKLDKEDEEFMKEQEQQIDCLLIDCCKEHKSYLNGL